MLNVRYVTRYAKYGFTYIMRGALYDANSFIKPSMQRSQLNLKREFVSFDMLHSVPPLIQTSIEGFHSVIGLPWWATFGVSTVMVRMSMFPLVYSQIVATKKIAAATPEINFLMQLLNKRLKEIKIDDTTERLNVISVFLKGVKSCLTIHGVSVLETLAYPFLNISLFITFVYSLRDMMDKADLGIETGGMLWFMDLTEKDPTVTLPLLAVGLSYVALELGFNSRVPGGVLVAVKDTLQCMLLISIPFVAGLPSGVFFYWIPSNLFGIAQLLVTRSGWFRLLAGLGPTAVR